MLAREKKEAGKSLDTAAQLAEAALKELETEVEAFRIKHLESNNYKFEELKSLDDKFQKLVYTVNYNDEKIRTRITNINDDLHIFLARDALASICPPNDSFSCSEKIDHIKFNISCISAFILSDSIIAELKLKRRKLEIELDRLTLPVIAIQAKTSEKINLNIEKQLRIINAKLELNAFVVKEISEHEKLLKNVVKQFQKNQIIHFKYILSEIYLETHNIDGVNILKEKLRCLIKNVTLIKSTLETAQQRTPAQGSTSSAIVQQELKQHSEAKKSAPEKSEENAILILAPALLAQLDRMTHVKKRPIDLGIDVHPPLYYCINWKHDVLLFELMKKAKRNKNSYGVAQWLLKKHKEEPLNGYNIAFQYFKSVLGTSLSDELFLMYLQIPIELAKNKGTLYKSGDRADPKTTTLHTHSVSPIKY